MIYHIFSLYYNNNSKIISMDSANIPATIKIIKERKKMKKKLIKIKNIYININPPNPNLKIISNKPVPCSKDSPSIMYTSSTYIITIMSEISYSISTLDHSTTKMYPRSTNSPPILCKESLISQSTTSTSSPKEYPTKPS